jgi:UDP-N-acetylmuramyl pentapeptide synthase
MTEALLKEQKKGDTILVKASHFMDFTRVVEALTAGE